MIEYPAGDYLNGKSIVLFYASYHSNCNITLDALKRLEKKYYNIKFIMVNTTKYYKLKEKHNVKALPALLYFKNGELVDFIGGSLNYKMIEDMILRN